MAVTLKEVAERAGVSRSAVSRTFTDGASVSAKTRSKVEKAARELGYSPSLIARSLATNRTKLIGLVANNFQNPIFLEVFDLYTQTLQQRGLRPLLVNLTQETDPAHSVQMLRQYSVDGVVVATSTLPPQFAQSFRDAQVPVVHAFGRYSPDSEVPVVGINNRKCGILAADTLLNRGYRAIAVLGGPEAATSTQDRVAGFKQRMAKAGQSIADIRFAANYSYYAGREAMHSLLSEKSVDAVFCGDDLICMGAMDAARSRGLSIPGDVGFLGFNDMDMSGWEAYALSTIRQPTRDIILASVDLVVDMVEKPEQTHESRLFECSVVERKTLKALVPA